MKQFGVVLVAAGKSSRFGGVQKKTFTALAGRAVWLHSLDLFLKRPDVAHIVVVIADDDRDEFDLRFRPRLLFESDVSVALGGAERTDSVANGLAALVAAAPGIEYVAVHDAARPCTTPSQIDAVFHDALASGAAILAAPVADTLKRGNDTCGIVETVPRVGLWQAQTPQVFRRDWIEEAYARRGEAAAATDDAQLLERFGRRVALTRGSAANLKITTADDLTLAEAILASRHPKKEEPAKPRFHAEDEELR
ncbi:MAG: 2-C-methyl-D-erythritol 4-phosphate cytidylyltransferase [Planctomycetia bacterium]